MISLARPEAGQVDQQLSQNAAALEVAGMIAANDFNVEKNSDLDTYIRELYRNEIEAFAAQEGISADDVTVDDILAMPLLPKPRDFVNEMETHFRAMAVMEYMA